MNIIYIVEDDDNIRELVIYSLTNAGFSVEGFSNHKSFFSAIEKVPPDLIFLDIMLPEMDGLQILKKLKQDPSQRDIPVIMLTAKNSEIDKVKGLDLGADDYITKPFGIMELISRAKANIRRSRVGTLPPTEASSSKSFDIILQPITIGSLIIDEAKRTANIPQDLTFKEFELLVYLAKNKDIVLSREKILSTIWGYDYEGESRTIDMHIKSLRKKLGKHALLIKTVRGVGYKITL